MPLLDLILFTVFLLGVAVLIAIAYLISLKWMLIVCVLNYIIFPVLGLCIKLGGGVLEDRLGTRNIIGEANTIGFGVRSGIISAALALGFYWVIRGYFAVPKYFLASIIGLYICTQIVSTATGILKSTGAMASEFGDLAAYSVITMLASVLIFYI